ncbi:MAG: HAD-IIA family hydrolase [Methylococcaceae bacterium]|nr:MAG: HAD-IIA family hydrolase [Methylococcaceae bacterium]
MEPLKDIRTLIIDMDGVLWHGDLPLPGLIAFFQTLREKSIRFILATNNASKTAEQYVAKLAKMGVTVSRDEILTSSQATTLYLAERAKPAATRVFVIGEDGLRQPLLERGFILTDLYEVKTADNPDAGAHYVVCGMDHDVSWDKLATATLNIRAGATFVGTNPDVTLPTEYGITHGNGAILAAIQAATDIAPIIIGKPEPIMYQQALKLLGVGPDETIAIGDRLGTDILGAVRANIRSLMVLTGVSCEADFAATDYRPDWVMPDIRDITRALRG